MCPRIDCASLDATLCYIFFILQTRSSRTSLLIPGILYYYYCYHFCYSGIYLDSFISLHWCDEATWAPDRICTRFYVAYDIQSVHAKHGNYALQCAISNLLISENSICRSELTYKFYFYKNKLLIFVKISQKQWVLFCHTTLRFCFCHLIYILEIMVLSIHKTW